MTEAIPTTNKNQSDRARQGLVVFSRIGQRDLFASDRITRVEEGWKILLRNPWYTGTHLSTFSFIRIIINGHEVPEANTLFALRGQLVPSAYLKYLHELFWKMGEVADVILTDPSLADALTDRNDIKVEIDMRTTFSYGFPDDTLPYRLTGELELH